MSDTEMGQGHVKDEPTDEIASPPAIKATPKKRGAAKAKSDESPTKKAKTPASGKKATLPMIPTCEAEITEADRLLIEMKDSGEPWIKITAMFEEKTGCKVGGSTCRMRYGKMKANLARVKVDDLETMKDCVAQVDADIEEQVKVLHRKRWAQVSAAMEAFGTEKYEAGTIEKAYKNLGANDIRSSSMAVAAENEEE